MSIMTEIRDMALSLAVDHPIPKIAGIVLPPFQPGEQECEDCRFMAMALEGGAAGLSYLLLPDDSADDYRRLSPQAFVGARPERYAEDFGGSDPVRNMLGLAAINAICQQVMRLTDGVPETAADSIGLMEIRDHDRVGMVGFFPPLFKYLHGSGAELVIVEKNPQLVDRYPNLPVTLDITQLKSCTKILCTSTTVLNGTLDEVLAQCRSAEHISVLGPTAGYFPDPLFARGVDVLGGRYVDDGFLLLKLIAEGKRWGGATRKLCFQKPR
ncbi:Rossmann-like domain-containing protein [Geothermobacter hydrogeniphilus]|uniref:Putative heavy-metal chelation domain-containing protein n=1 Tax=Geothermobacter hydrogeniphilus TaxID=1969733 RepID=A0A1X0XK21_9BACT|nr:DUF364 domain-containing protein [Geothermobacter hydrogeniphilus]ORJ53216.1 hypothetical protein B5V00_16525 [Geothermobacter hydrogeniphilus]